MSRDHLEASAPLIKALLEKWAKENRLRKEHEAPTGKSLAEAMNGRTLKASTLATGTTPTPARPLEGRLGVSVRGATPREIESVDVATLKLNPVNTGSLDVPKLSYGLERVLFNPGVYQLQDPRSKVYNFDPYLQAIMPVSEFDFNALKAYVTSSKDVRLMGMARQEKMKYTGSTSSMTSALAHFHFLLSQWRPINAGALSRDFPVEFDSFTQLQRGPSAIFLRYTDGVYAIDADKEFDGSNILSMLGKSMEKLLTLPTNDFERYRKPNSSQISEEERNEEEAFHYTTMGDFLMRSQLDAHDSRLPGTGMFDLKTRAVVAIRMDTSQYEVGSGYEIRSRFGEFESYEREYYDMIRSAFLKYSLQVRMGRMDGIFVAYHNTERIFGFQYVSLPEMDYALHGSYDTTIGDSEFKLSVDLLNRVLDRATAKYPGKSLRMFFETRVGSPSHFMYIFVEPVEEKEIDRIQTTNKSEIEEFEARVLGINGAEDESKSADSSEAAEETEVEEEDIEQTPGTEDAEHAQKLVDDFANAALQEDDGDDEEEEDEVQDSDEDEDDEEEEEESEDEDDEDENDESDEEEEVDQEDKESEVEEDAIVQAPEEGGKLDESAKTSLNETPLIDLESKQAESEADARDAFTIDEIKDSISGQQQDDSPGNTTIRYVNTNPHIPPKEDDREVFAMVLKLRNKINGRYIERPNNLNSKDSWEVEYQIAEVDTVEKARELYAASKLRRQQIFRKDTKDKDKKFRTAYSDKLLRIAKYHRAWREGVEAKEGLKPKIRLDKSSNGEQRN